jgi:periplasmic protein TonB
VPVPKRKPRPPAETVTQATPEPPAFPRKPAEETQTTGISEAAETTVAEISPASPAATNGEQGLSRRTQIARSGGGHVSELGDYLATVRSWLHDHKRYPRRARLRMLQGDATIGFVLDRSGRVVSYTLQKSSGHDMLDREVLAMIRRASPMPPIPPSLARNQMDFSVPVRFDMR